MDHGDLARNAAALLRFARSLRDLVADVEIATGRSLRAHVPGPDWKEGRPRSDAWTEWTDGRSAPGIRVWLNGRGLAIGLTPGKVRPGWFEEAAVAVETNAVAGMETMRARDSAVGDDVGFVGGASGEFLYGRWFERKELADLDLRSELVAVAGRLRPTLDALVVLAGGHDTAPVATPEDDPLTLLAAEFRRWGYPKPSDEIDKADRAAFAALIADGAIDEADPVELRKIWNTRRYGGPGPQSRLNATLRDPATYDRFLRSVAHLCWGPGDDAARIDNLLTDPQWEDPRPRRVGDHEVVGDQPPGALPAGVPLRRHTGQEGAPEPARTA